MSGSRPPGDWDAIVVGAGLGGLTCAAYLAAGGLRVVVLEQHDWAGGNSHVFRRRRAYEFDVGVHYVGDCGPDGIVPAVLAGVGVRDRVPFRQLDPAGFDRVVLPGRTVDVPADWDGYGRRVRAALPDPAPAVDGFLDVCRRVAAEQRGALLAPAGTPAGGIAAATQTVRAWGRRPLAELFDHFGLSTVARTLLAAQSPNYGMSPATATVATHAVVTDHYLRGAYFPVGGGQMLSAALVEALEANGGELRTRAGVAKILVSDGAVTGVRLTDGTTLAAPLVVSNADYRRTVLDLVGAEHFSRTTATRTREATMGLPFGTVYVALDRPLRRPSEANLWWYAEDDIEALYRDLEADQAGEDVRFLFVSFGSLKDPDSPHGCPPGHANFQLMTMCAPGSRPWGVPRGPADGGSYRRDPAYRAAKERFTAAVLRAAERALGPFRENIVHLETATPLTQERYTGSTGGSPFGLARWGRGGGSRPDTATGVTGLHVVGQSTRYGSGVTGVMVSGIACAGGILGRSLMAEVHRGAVLGHAGLLPDRLPGWDPLAVSRGAARRDARGLSRLGSRAG